MKGGMRAAWSVAMMTSALVMGGGPAWAQVSDSALKDRVAQLVERLESPKMEARAAAEKALIDLGPRVTPLLPTGADKAKADLAERLERVRASLREKDEQTNLGASRVTIKGKGIRLTEVLKALQVQSGNTINDLREANGEEATNPALDLEIDDRPFYEALDIFADKAGVSYTPYTNDGTIGLMAGAPSTPTPNMPARVKPLVVYTGPFRVLFKQLVVVRDFQTGVGTCNATFDVMWEPRLRPMLMAVKNEDLKIVDDQGKPVPGQVTQEADEAALRAGNCAAEMNLNLSAPERSAKLLSSFKVKAAITVPSGMKSFRFPRLTEANSVQKQGDISVKLESVEVDAQVWKVALEIAYPEGGPAFESYRQGLFNNRLWLQKPDGSRFEQNGGFNNTGSDGGKISFEYLFVDAPGKPADHMLVYETPAKVVPIPLEFEFKDVPLP